MKLKKDRTILRGLGPIATDKTLDLLNSELFMDWNTNILESYGLSLKMEGKRYLGIYEIFRNNETLSFRGKIFKIQ
ncbi:hypothetical protein [Ferroplasma acidiphilum]|uniref:hypothetical protein n=1 Tax=Ferroplasma acidiphilum TaxID=74969 RepID=UPI0023F13185|nr:hypothetical protein [Ferroplasma acidiphilum]